jgi:hypothetical protein
MGLQARGLDGERSVDLKEVTLIEERPHGTQSATATGEHLSAVDHDARGSHPATGCVNCDVAWVICHGRNAEFRKKDATRC